MGTSELLLLVIVVTASVAMIVAPRRSWSPSTGRAIACGAVLRMAVAIVAVGHTPLDEREISRTVAVTAAHGLDPTVHLPAHLWSFLPPLTYWHRLALELPLRWEIADKMLPIVSDLVTVWLVGKLCVDRPKLRQLQYAVNPISLLVVAWHGQGDVVAVTCAVAALVLARSGRATTSGLVLGLAIAAKTWPILFVPALFAEISRRRERRRLLMAAGGFCAALYLTLPLFLQTDLLTHARIVATYTSATSGQWGWSSLVYVATQAAHLTYDSRAVNVVAAALTILFLGALWLRFRGRDGLTVALATIFCFAIVGAGVAVQYTLWPTALILAAPTRQRIAYWWSTVVYASYVYAWHAAEFVDGVRLDLRVAEAVLSIPAVILAVIALRATVREPKQSRVSRSTEARVARSVDAAMALSWGSLD